MIYVSSDWHGCSPSKIKQLLKRASFSEEDFLFVLGDVIDRGIYGIELLKWMMEQPNIELILGNHEAMLLSCDFLFEEITDELLEGLTSDKLYDLKVWERNGAEPTIAALHRETPEMRQDILEYLKEAPLHDSVCVDDKDYLLVHAGLGGYRADKKIRDYEPDQFLWTRPELDTEYSKDFITIIGHTPTFIYGEEYKGKILKTPTWWNIDTGAAFDRAPMLLCLDNMKEYYIEE